MNGEGEMKSGSGGRFNVTVGSRALRPKARFFVDKRPTKAELLARIRRNLAAALTIRS
jgi:hypothetical protein